MICKFIYKYGIILVLQGLYVNTNILKINYFIDFIKFIIHH